MTGWRFWTKAFEGLLRKFYLKANDETIQSDENLFISSGQEAAFRDLTVKGVCINRGYALARTLKIDGGKVIIDGGTFAVNYHLLK